MASDRSIRCVDCGKDFWFTVKDQEFYKRMGFGNAPKRCKPCRETRKQERDPETRRVARERVESFRRAEYGDVR